MEKGVEVENIEYMRFSTHFLVVTVKRDSLLKSGVLLETKDSVRESLQSENVNLERLREFARLLATAAGVPASSPFAAAHAVNIFDFSCKGRLLSACTALSSQTAIKNPLVFPIGDALVNPFWPQGLGVNRGFHSALDAVWSIYLDAVHDRQEALRERDVAYNIMLWLPMCSSLVLPGVGWRADPLSRYQPKIIHSMHMSDLRKNATATSLTQRILKTIAK